MAIARVSIGKISLTVRYAALAPEDARKKQTDSTAMKTPTPPVSREEQRGETDRHPRRAQIGQGDHRFSADGVEQSPEQQWTGEVAQRPHDEEQRHGARCDAVERAQQRAEVEGERVV